ncbi:MAG: DUF2029 domain-containing protein [Bacteroidetes bacterium]|nr:DUF2029 domain-containing protein [Bacteroidota bacterium]
MDRFKDITPAFIISLSILLIGILISFYCIHKPLGDFGNYYFGAKLIEKENVWNSIYDVYNFNEQIRKLGYENLFLSHTTVAPQSLLFYKPLSYVSNPFLAKLIFNLSGVVLFSICFFYFLRTIKIEIHHIIILASAVIPIYYNILFGQAYLFVCGALLIITHTRFQKNNHFISFILAMIISIKITPVIFLLYFFLTKNYKVLFLTALYWCVILLATSLIVDTDTIYRFYTQITPKLSSGFVNDPFSSSYYGVIVVLHKLFLYDEVLNSAPFIQISSSWINLINGCIVSALLVIIGIVITKIKNEIAFCIFTILVFSNMTSGYNSTYSLLLLVPFCLTTKLSKNYLFVFALIAILLLPPRLFDGSIIILAHYKLILFTLLLILILKEVKFEFKLNKSILFISSIYISLITINFARSKDYEFNYFPPIANKSIHYVQQYSQNSNTLTYTYFNYSGIHIDSTKVSNPIEKCIKNKNILLQDGSEINTISCIGDTIVFLTDYKRGPGLYNIFYVTKNNLQDLPFTMYK